MLFVFAVPRKLAHDHRRADILQRGIDRVGHQLHHDRLMRAGQHQARARFRHEVVRAFGQPLLVEFHRALRRGLSVAIVETKPASFVAAAILPASA